MDRWGKPALAALALALVAALVPLGSAVGQAVQEVIVANDASRAVPTRDADKAVQRVLDLVPSTTSGRCADVVPAADAELIVDRVTVGIRSPNTARPSVYLLVRDTASTGFHTLLYIPVQTAGKSGNTFNWTGQLDGPFNGRALTLPSGTAASSLKVCTNPAASGKRVQFVVTGRTRPVL